MKNIVNKAVILCGGYGTRSMPASKATPKELFPVGDKPAIQFHLEECYKSGIREVLIVTNEYKRPYFENFLSHNEAIESSMERGGSLYRLDGLNELIDNMKINYAIQPVMNGTGGAVLCAIDWLNGEPFALIFGDDMYEDYKGRPAISLLKSQFESNNDGKSIIGCKEVSLNDISRYCSIKTTEKINSRCFKFDKIIEKPTPEQVVSNLSGLGRYIVQGDIEDYILRTPARGKNSEIGLTDTFNLIAEESGEIYCFNMPQTHRDLGNKLTFNKTIIENGLRNPEYGKELTEYIIELGEELKKNPNLLKKHDENQ